MPSESLIEIKKLDLYMQSIQVERNFNVSFWVMFDQFNRGFTFGKSVIFGRCRIRRIPEGFMAWRWAFSLLIFAFFIQVETFHLWTPKLNRVSFNTKLTSQSESEKQKDQESTGALISKGFNLWASLL